MEYLKAYLAWWNKHIFWGSVIFALVVTLIIYIVTGGSAFSNGSGGDTLKCNTCGHVYEAGDNGGNYMNIARTGMCKSCYKDFMALQEAVGD